MNLTSPKLTLTFLGNDLPAGRSASQVVDDSYIIKSSITRDTVLLNGLKSASNQIRMAISKDCSSVADIVATDGDIKAVLTDGLTTLFTGYISTSFAWKVTQNGEQALQITLEDVTSRLLNKPFIQTGYHLFNASAADAIGDICDAAGITISSSAVAITDMITFVAEAGATCRELLDQMLYELGYVYYCDNLGELRFFKVDVTSLSNLPTIDKDDLYEKNGQVINLSKKIRQYRSVRMTYTTLGTASDYLVYRNTTGADDAHPYCNMELQSGEHFDGLEIYTAQEWSEATADEFREPALIEACNAASETSIVGSNKILAISELRSVTDKGQHITISMTHAGGPYIAINAQNNGLSAESIVQMDLYASILYEKSQNIIRTGISGNTTDSLLTEDCRFIHTKELMTKHANLVCQYNAYCNSRYTFYSEQDLACGSLIHLNENVFSGLAVDVMIIGKSETDKSSLKQYTAIGVSVFSLEDDVYHRDTATGKADTKGEKGTGSQWKEGTVLVGTTYARGVVGNEGDYYLNTETFNIYRCIVSGGTNTALWQYTGNIKGKDYNVTGYTYEIEYGLSTSPDEFIYVDTTLGYDSTNAYGYQEDREYGFYNYGWGPTVDGWYHGLYVWQRIKITDADGNITYEDPTYAAEVTQSLEDSCTIAVESSPITYTNNPRRTDDQYLGLTLKDVGYRGTLVLRTSQGGFAEYNNLTQAYEDIIDPSTGEIANQLEVYFSGTNIVSGYYLKLPYALDEIVYLTGTLTEWTSYQVYTSLTITPATEKTTAIQLDMVNVAAELPQSVNVNNQEQGVAYRDNLIRGDYTLVKYVTLTATTTNSAVDEEGTTHPFTDFGAYYSKNGNEFTKLTISAFVVDTVYYAFRLYPWMYDGEAWHRTNDSAVKTNTVEKVVQETKWQHDNIDSSLDYHDCLVAYDAYIMNLSAAIINAGDIFANNITSNNYEEDTDGAPTKGYKLVHSSSSAPNGEIKSFGGVYTNMNVRGNLNLFNGEEAGAEIKHPALSTNPGTAADTQGATIPVPSPTTWFSSSLYGDTRLVENYIYEQASGLYNLNKPISKLLRLTNKNATYIQGASQSWSQGSTSAKSWNCTLQIPSNIPTSVQVSISGSTGRNVVKTPKARLYIDEVLVQETDYGNSSYSFSVSVSGGQTVKLNLVCYAQFHQTGAYYYQFKDATCTMSYSSVSFAQLGFNAEGIWLYYNNQWNNKGTNSAVSEPAYLTSPIRWYDSGHYVQPTPFTSYSGGDVTMTPGIPYKIGSQNLMLNNVGIVGKYFTKNTDGTRTLTYTDSNGENQTDLLLSPLNYYYISGRIWIAGTYRGVEMMGCYPVKDAATDPQGGYDCGRSDRQWNTGYFLDVITNGTSITSAREKKNVMGDYIGSALSLLNKTKIVEFSYKVDKTNTPHIGFIADDTPVELSGIKQDSMVVGDCIGVLIKAVQELSAEINRLKGGNN